MQRKGTFAVVITVIGIACLCFESASLAQVRQKSKTKTASKRSSAPFDGKPTAADAKAVIEQRISGGRFKVNHIIKTNGAEIPMLNQYQIFYTVKVTCLVSEGKRSFPLLADPSTTQAILCENGGDVHNGTGSLYFYKTEQGWRPYGQGPFYIGWFERLKGDYQPASDKNLILVPVPKGITKAPAQPTAPVSVEYDRFIGVWSYANDFNEKQYFRITKDQRGRIQFDEGWNDDSSSKITWNREGLILNNADGIFLKPSKGNLHAKFVSANFRATHGHDFSYQITLQFQPNGKLLYLLSGDLQEKHTATKIDEN